MSSNRTSLHSMAFGALASGALASGALTLAPSAQAQTCDPDSIHSSYPADGAMGVPTNTPIYVYGPELEIGTHDVTLEDGSGTAVNGVEVLAAEGGLLIEPVFGLTPGTTYELTLSPRAAGDDWSASFTTGTGPSNPVQLEAPDVAVTVINRNSGSCGAVSAVCVTRSASTDDAFTVPTRMTLEVLVGGEVLSLGGGQPAPAYKAGGGTVAANDCIEVRVREPGGNVSEETRICGNALSRVELAASAAAPTSCLAYAPAVASDDDEDEDEDDDEDDGGESGGCALGTMGTTPAASRGALVLLLGALLGLRRRRLR